MKFASPIDAPSQRWRVLARFAMARSIRRKLPQEPASILSDELLEAFLSFNLWPITWSLPGG